MRAPRGRRRTGLPLGIFVSVVLHAGLFAAGAYVVTNAAGGTGGGGSGGDEPSGFVIHVSARSSESAPDASPAPTTAPVPAPEAKVEPKPDALVPVETPVTLVPEAPPESAVADAIANAVADAVAYGFADARAETTGASRPVEGAPAKSSGTTVPEQGSSGSGGGAGSGAGTGIGTHAGAGADGAGPATRASPATLVFGPKPEYPASSILRGEVGSVLCTIQIGADGRVTDVAVTRSSGHERLDRSAVDTLRRWIFEPAKADDRAISSRFVHQVVFRLD